MADLRKKWQKMPMWQKGIVIGLVVGILLWTPYVIFASFSFGMLYAPIILLFFALVGGFCGLIIGGLNFALKKKFKSFPAWLKGAIAGVIIFLVQLLLYAWVFYSVEGDAMIWAFLPISPNLVFGYLLFILGYFPSFHPFNALALWFILLNLALYFIAGAVIGLIAAKTKNKNKK